MRDNVMYAVRFSFLELMKYCYSVSNQSDLLEVLWILR